MATGGFRRTFPKIKGVTPRPGKGGIIAGPVGPKPSPRSPDYRRKIIDRTNTVGEGGKTDGFLSYAAGGKKYGGGRSMPNIGPSDPSGYRERDAKAQATRDAMLRRMKARKAGRFMSADNLDPKGRSY